MKHAGRQVNDVIAKAIAASRERESRGRGPCPCESDEVCHCWMEYSIGLETWEPRFREALAVAVEQLGYECYCLNDVDGRPLKDCDACKAVDRIAAILVGEGK